MRHCSKFVLAAIDIALHSPRRLLPWLWATSMAVDVRSLLKRVQRSLESGDGMFCMDTGLCRNRNFWLDKQSNRNGWNVLDVWWTKFRWNFLLWFCCYRNQSKINGRNSKNFRGKLIFIQSTSKQIKLNVVREEIVVSKMMNKVNIIKNNRVVLTFFIEFLAQQTSCFN